MKQSLLFFTLFVVLSCNKQVDINFPDDKSKLVVNSTFSDNGFMVVKVYKTINYNSNENKYVEDATCKLFCDDVFVENLVHHEQGIYKSTIVPIKGKKYSIEVSASGFKTVMAESRIPVISTKISLDTIHTVIFDPNDGLGVYYTKGILKIIDDTVRQNFYLTKLKLVYPDGEIYNPITKYRSDEPTLTDNGLLNYKPSLLLYNDIYFHKVDNFLVFEYDFPVWFEDTLLLITTTKFITKDYYEYAKSTIIQMNNQGSSDNLFAIGEPITVYSNIKNGYGIFAGYSSYSDTLIINGWSGAEDVY